MTDTQKPLLILLAQALPNRIAPLVRLAETMPIEVVDFANDVPHGGGLTQLPDEVPQIDAGLKEIPGLISSGRYRAVMIETQGPASFTLAAFSAHRAGLPLIVWMGLQEVPRTLRWRLGGWILRKALRWSDAVISYGTRQADLAADLGARNIIGSIDPLDLDFWSVRLTGERSGGLRFVFAGRRELEKGPHILVEAWELSDLADRGATLKMVGGGSWAPRNGFPAGISTEGPSPRERVREIYGRSDILVVPSITTRTFKEPWGMVVGEAMAQGLSVIATDSVGAAASGLAVDGETALVVPEGDAEALAAAMQRLAADGDLRQRLSAAGESRARDFGPDRWIRDMVSAVESATVGHR